MKSLYREMKGRVYKWIINRGFWSDDETELLKDAKLDKEKELENGKEFKNEIKTININININIEDFESDPFCFWELWKWPFLLLRTFNIKLKQNKTYKEFCFDNNFINNLFFENKKYYLGKLYLKF